MKVIGSAKSEVPAVRSVREALIEMLILSITILFLMAFLATPPIDANRLPRALEWAQDAGENVLAHIGWGFGVYIPTLLGFYALVIGGQLSTSPEIAGRTRRILGFFAELMVVALVPALALAAVASVQTAGSIGALFVIIPAAGVAIFLAALLGSFVVPERHQQLSAALQTRQLSNERLQNLASRSRRPVWAVLLVNSVLSSLAGTLVSAVLLFAMIGSVDAWGLFSIWWPLGIVATIIVVFSWPLLYLRLMSEGKFSTVVFWLVFISMYLIFSAVLIRVATLNSAGFIVVASFSTIAILLSASAFWPRKHMPDFALDWSLQGAAIRAAAHATARTYRKAVREIRELSPRDDHSQSPTWVERIVAAGRALNGKAV